MKTWQQMQAIWVNKHQVKFPFSAGLSLERAHCETAARDVSHTFSWLLFNTIFLADVILH